MSVSALGGKSHEKHDSVSEGKWNSVSDFSTVMLNVKSAAASQ